MANQRAKEAASQTDFAISIKTRLEYLGVYQGMLITEGKALTQHHYSTRVLWLSELNVRMAPFANSQGPWIAWLISSGNYIFAV